MRISPKLLLLQILFAFCLAGASDASGTELAAGEFLLSAQTWASGSTASVELHNPESSSFAIGARVDSEGKGLWLNVDAERAVSLVYGSPSESRAGDIKEPLRHLWSSSNGFLIHDFGDRVDIYGLIGSVPVPLTQIDIHETHIVAYYNGRMLAYPAISEPVPVSGHFGVHAGSGPLTEVALDAAAMGPSIERFTLLEHENGADLTLTETFSTGLDNPLAFRPWAGDTRHENGALVLGRIDTLMKYGEAEIRMDLEPSGGSQIEVGLRQTYPFFRPWIVGGSWLVFQGDSDLLRIRKSISERQAEVPVTMPQAFAGEWTIRISESAGVLRVFREHNGGDTLLAELVETGGVREVRDASGAVAGTVPLERTARGHFTIKGAGRLDNLSISGNAWYSAADRPPPVYTPDPAEVFHVETAGRLMGVHVGEQNMYGESREMPLFSGVEEVLQYPDTDRELYRERDGFWLNNRSIEPALDYRTAGNPDLIRTYLRMQSWAGVDYMVFMDSSNYDWGDLNDNYFDTLDLWLEAMLELRGQGVTVPRAVFWVNNTGSLDGSAMEVYERYYSNPAYRDLWLYKDGKPMLFTVNMTGVRQTHFSVLQDYFTVRSMWVTQRANMDWNHNMLSARSGSWEVLANRGNVIDGVLEHMFVNPASRIAPYHDLAEYSAVARMPNGLFTDVALLTEEDDGWWRGRNQGRFWQIQWEQIFEQQPQFVTSQAWNAFGHSFDQEYGRAIAPMKDGHSDRYLWMLRAYAEAYKAGEPFPADLLESDFPFAGVMPISSREQNMDLNAGPLWALDSPWPWPGNATTVTRGDGGHLVMELDREARQWTMEGAEAVFDEPVAAGSRTWLTMAVQLRDVVCERPQDYELKIRVFGGGRWTEGTFLPKEGEWQLIGMDLSNFEHRDAIDRIKVWVQGTRNTDYANWSAGLEVRDVWLSGGVTRPPGKYNFEVVTWPQERKGVFAGEEIPVYLVNYDTEALTGGIGVSGGDGVDFLEKELIFDRIEPRESTVLYLQGKRFVLNVDRVNGHALLPPPAAVFEYGETLLTRTLAGPEDPLSGWTVSSAWNDVSVEDDGILFGTGGGMIWPEPGGIHMPENRPVADLRAAFNLKLVEAGSNNWFHFNFRKTEQHNHHLHSGGYSLRIESHFIRLVAGSNQTQLSVDLRPLLGSGFSFANGYSRVEITVVGESLEVTVNDVKVMETNLRALNEPLYVESGMINFFNAANRGVYSMNTMSLEILDAPFISSISDRVVNENSTTGPIPFTIGHPQADPDELTLSAESSDPGLVPVSGIVFDGSGTDRSVTVFPETGQTGSAMVTIRVSDGFRSATTSFTVTVPGTEWTDPAHVRLEISLDEEGTVRIAWPASAPEAVLQVSTDLREGFSDMSPIEILIEDDQHAVYDSDGLPVRFYRLRFEPVGQ